MSPIAQKRDQAPTVAEQIQTPRCSRFGAFSFALYPLHRRGLNDRVWGQSLLWGSVETATRAAKPAPLHERLAGRAAPLRVHVKAEPRMARSAHHPSA